jgi:uncharacterized membrane protein YkvA (DUF1232 family)
MRDVALALGIVVALYAAFVGTLVVYGRGEQVRAWARVLPDGIVLVRRLLRDPRVPRARKLSLLALALYLASPIDLVPDIVPVAGHLDDAIVFALVLRGVLRAAGPEVVREHWPGDAAMLDRLLRLGRVSS